VFKTEDGFEITHQVNFLAHVLSHSPSLAFVGKSARASAWSARRVASTSWARLILANCNGELGKTGGKGARFYPNNKLWFQVWLAGCNVACYNITKYKHITVNGVHPGYVNSGIWNLNFKAGWLTQVRSSVAKLMAYCLGIDEQQGSWQS